ncbi:glycoside hydrolase family 125 protein [Streptomyces sp. NBC_00576]|uniref:glycoside hydrolase family 125 protein n=1 Tax=Streptomyces sp. NBC_00576 TaxID=2903665 RepID=UPI002E81AB4F|nr:glycoside hydrolase family 125 protein [Streptomyces sp. NBC_00576]WUB74843.1 glycoside hydrolase family 125 protein [Streptomyces sp. NBC_00576]
MRSIDEPEGELPEGLRALSADVHRELRSLDARAADRFTGLLTGTWGRAMRPLPDGEVFVLTGDIPAMWLRDSTAQVRPYLLAADDPAVAAALTGVLRRQLRYVLADPYANSFNAEPDGSGAGYIDEPTPDPLVWEQKYEVDSLCAPLQLAYGIWRATGSLGHLTADDRFVRAARRIIALWRVEQDHENRSPYEFRRLGDDAFDSLPRGGRGAPVAPTGMTWSGFRPSDDRCHHGYLVPSNAMAAVALAGLAELATALQAPDLAADATALSAEIATGVRTHGVTAGADPTVYAYEVDGLGGQLLMDDANIPSLLSLPYLGWCDPGDQLYLRTREFVLSEGNPYYYAGSSASGIGSPHTPPGHVWPLSLTMQALTSDDAAERVRLAELLLRTDGATGSVHESFHVDDPGTFTRPWFGWGDALFAELLLDLTGRSTTRLHPHLPTTELPSP